MIWISGNDDATTNHRPSQKHVKATTVDRWWTLTAKTLGLDPAGAADEALSKTFVQLGGTSLRAVEFAASARRELGRTVDVATLLSPRPLGEISAAAGPAPLIEEPPSRSAQVSTAGPGQQSMLLTDQIGGTAFHLLFTADIEGPLDSARLEVAIAAVLRRHPALRTVFSTESGLLTRRIVTSDRPLLLHQELPEHSTAPISAIHSSLATRSHQLLRPFERPPLTFVLSRLATDRHALSVLVHHCIADGWSIGILFRDLFDYYDRGAFSSPPVAAVDLESGQDHLNDRVSRRAAEVAALPRRIAVPSAHTRPAVFDRSGTRYEIRLTAVERDACHQLAGTCGVTKNVALMSAWAMAVGRLAGVREYLLGLSVSGRATTNQQEVIGLGTKLAPVAVDLAPSASVQDFVTAMGEAAGAALSSGDLPLEHLVHELGAGGDLAASPLVQFAFSAHDELIPTVIHSAELKISIEEGHCGGTPFDAILYVRRWDDEAAILVVEFATTALGPEAAGTLVAGFRQSLKGLAAASEAKLASVGTMTDEQAERLADIGSGPPAGLTGGIWQTIEQSARNRPQATAIRAADTSLTFSELLQAVEQRSADLAAAGVSEGDCVALAIERSAAELVWVLAILRIGAHYFGVDSDSPAAVIAEHYRLARPRVTVVTRSDLQNLDQISVPTRRLATDHVTDSSPHPPVDPAGSDLDRVAYIAFTSGSTGQPKAVRIPVRAVMRLVSDPDLLRQGSEERFVRLAPLGFDASTLELFVPLALGGSLVVYPPGLVDVDLLARFIDQEGVTGLWLTAGLFRVMATFHPSAFGRARQLLTGGDVVPPEQVRRVLTACPQLRITNGYGPTENTTFTTVHHLDDACEVETPLPIGRPVAGTELLVVDASGLPTPPGGIGELLVSGDGLAVDYADDSRATAAAFTHRSDGRRWYRTGDLVRWDGRGRLQFAGRRDNQVKVRGFRVELGSVEAALQAHPEVTDAVVTTFVDETGERRILAAVVTDQVSADQLREFATTLLPGHAIPSRWVLTDLIPLTANGKPDVAALVKAGRRTESSDQPALSATPPPDRDDLVDAIARAWERVLDTDDFDLDESFFDVGGSSIMLPVLRDEIRRTLPDSEISVMALLRHPTVAGLATYLGLPDRP